MKFVRIEMLWLIWAVPVVLLIFWAGMRRRNRILREYARGGGLEAIRGQAGSGRRWFKAGLLMAVLLFCVLALTGPQYGYRWREIEQRGVDIIVAMDCSRSMLATDISPTRLDRARREVFDLLAMLEGDRIGLAAFSGVAFLQCPLTLDYESFHLFLQNLSPEFLPLGGTDIAGAIDAAVAGFKKDDNTEKAVILITDGESTGGDPLEAAKRAQAAGVKIFCIGVGGDEAAPIPDKEGGFKKDRAGQIVMARLDEETLKKIAVLTGGVYVRSVAGDMDLENIYSREIRGKMENSTLSSGRKQIWEDRYQYVLILALLALAAELFLGETRKAAAGMAVFLVLALHQPCGASPFKSDDVQKGMDAYAREEYQTALDHFIKAQLEDPDRAEIYYNIGNAYYKLGDYENALRSFQKAMNTDKTPLKQKTLYNMGNTDFRKGKYKEAIDHYEKALKIDPKDQLASSNIEFVKKVMEQQQQPPPQQESGKDQDQKKEEGEDQKDKQDGSKSGQEDGEKKPGEQQNEQQSKEGDQEQQEKKQPQAGDQGQEEKQEEQQQAGEEDKDQKQDEGQQAMQAAENKEPNGQKPDDEGAKQADRILNRLQDRPGVAMFPQYRERNVEKDW